MDGGEHSPQVVVALESEDAILLVRSGDGWMAVRGRLGRLGRFARDLKAWIVAVNVQAVTTRKLLETYFLMLMVDDVGGHDRCREMC